MKTIGRTWSIVIAVVVAAAVLAGGWFGLVKPKKDKVSSLKSQVTEQEDANTALRLQVSVLKSLAKKLPQQQAELAALKTKVPDKVQLSALLRQLVDAAQTSGVTLTGFTPQAPQPLAGAAGIQYVDLVITFTGGYADVATYDSTLESLSRTLMVKDFTLAGAENSSGSGSSSSSSQASTDTVTATFNGRVLVRDDSASSSGSSSSSTPTSGSTGTPGTTGTSGTSTGSSGSSSTAS